ncbi:MAG: hypothetical protein ACN6QT_23980, partial [Burkholderia contaminans]
MKSTSNISGHFFSCDSQWFACLNEHADCCSARITAPFSFDLSACQADPNACVAPRPDCRPGMHDGLASPARGYLPRFSAPIRRVNFAGIHVHSSSSRLSNRQFH